MAAESELQEGDADWSAGPPTEAQGQGDQAGSPSVGSVPAGLPWTLPLRHQSLPFVLCSLKGGHHSLAGVTAASRVQETWLLWTRCPQGSPAETTVPLAVFRVNIASPDLGHGESLVSWRGHQYEASARPLE